ncbi:phytoene desaturase family protein [Terrisporobacter sp.]
MNKKIIVIGGGLAGLTAGIYGLKAGYDVSIYEKNNIAGGECTGWDRKGYHIDNCIHWMMGTTKGSDLYNLWIDVGAISDDIEILRSDKMYTSMLNGKSITLWSNLEKTRKELIELSKEDEDEINKLIDNVKLSMDVAIPADKPPELKGPLELLKMLKKYKNTMKVFKIYENEDTKDLMDKFKHPLIKCMLSDFCPKESKASSFPMSYGNFIAGDGGIPRGGSRAMSLRMADKFKTLGGKMFTNTPVEKVIVEENKAKGIILENGEKIYGDYIIPSCDTDFTFNHLLDKSYMDPSLKKMYENHNDYFIYGMFQVAYGIDSSEDLLKGEIMTDLENIKIAPWIGDRITLKTYAYEPSFAPEGKQILQALLPLDVSAYDYWMDLYKDKEKYNSKKEELANLIMKKIEGMYEGYRGKITILDSWTPVTYKRYCNAYKGYNQAFVMGKRTNQKDYPSAYIKGIDNVILCGQWINPPGGVCGAAITGKFAIQRILKKENKSLNI